MRNWGVVSLNPVAPQSVRDTYKNSNETCNSFVVQHRRSEPPAADEFILANSALSDLFMSFFLGENF